jgi:hypothetical protein
VTDAELLIAREVHALLLSAHPQPTDVNLAKSAELASGARRAEDDFRAVTFLAIQKARKAIADGASASEGEQLLLEAIRAAEHWVEARAGRH